MNDLTHECTSWMVFSDLTGLNANILHKNRDAEEIDILVLKNAPDAPRKWIGLGSKEAHPCMGMNAMGLVGVMNSGELCIDPSTDDTKRETPMLLKEILENCDTAVQAVEAVQRFLKAGDYWHKDRGSIFLFLDKNEGYVCENTAKFSSVQRHDNGYAFRANIWHNPGMDRMSRNTPDAFLDSCVREHVVREKLNAAIDRDGRITLMDIRDLARCKDTPENTSLTRTVCSAKTNSCSTFVLHREYPDVLSTGWFCIGQPRHTLFLPFPICLESLPASMTRPDWSTAARQRLERLGVEAPMPPEWLAFEQRSQDSYTQAAHKALELLKNGQKPQARNLLNNAASQIWQEGSSLLGI
ncbi:MAG: hypothetical protein IJJ33_14815 [Victivallales bacterium]|nr:hypothetical protein [Victivallales bacterium]